jgi:hypothetical protein
LTETIKPSIKISLLSPNHTPPIDISSSLVSVSIDALHRGRRDISSAGSNDPRRTGKTGPFSSVKKFSVAQVPKGGAIPAAPSGAPTQPEKPIPEHPVAENEGAMFADLDSAITQALTVLITHEEVISPEKDKNVPKKKGATNEVSEPKGCSYIVSVKVPWSNGVCAI